MSMSAISPPEEEQQPLRTDYWGTSITEPEPTHGHAELSGTSWEEYVAHAILRHGAEMLCPACIHEEDRATVLSDPEEYVPKQVETSWGTVELHVLRHRRRVCPHEDCGYISFGGVLADRDADEFLALVEEVLSSVDLPPSRHEKLLNDARSRKYDGRKHDTKIMEWLVRDLEQSGSTRLEPEQG